MTQMIQMFDSAEVFPEVFVARGESSPLDYTSEGIFFGPAPSINPEPRNAVGASRLQHHPGVITQVLSSNDPNDPNVRLRGSFSRSLRCAGESSPPLNYTSANIIFASAATVNVAPRNAVGASPL